MKKLLCLLAAVTVGLFIYSAPVLADNPDSGIKNFPVEGIVFGSWWNGEYQSASADESLNKLMQTGADHVCILGTWYMDTTPADGERTTSNTIYSHAQKTPSDSDLIHVIGLAKAANRKVMLKLHVRVILNNDPYGNWSDAWAGNITPSDLNAWFSSYTQFVQHYASVAEAEGVDILCFGTELTSTTTSANAAQWDSVIDAIKAIYTGKLTFSSNMYLEYKQIPFWNRCDYLGIGPYFSLTTNEANPNLDTMVEGWFNSPIDGRLIQKMEQWSAQHNKPIIFTELGYCSVDTAAFRPWKGTAGLPENWPLQKRCYDALFLALQNKPWFAGAFWWDWLTDPNAGTTGLNRKEYTPQNKDAEMSLKNFYLGIAQADVASIKIVNGDGVEIADASIVNLGGTKKIYAQGYNASGQVLGFMPVTWRITDQGGSLESNQVGFALFRALEEGTVTVTATTQDSKTDSVTFNISQRYLRVPSQYSTIQAAMAAAGSGDIILVDEGVYNEGDIFMKAGVKLCGGITKAKTTIINGGIVMPASRDETTQVGGFTITNTNGAGIRGAIWLGVEAGLIKNNILKGNADAGIIVYGSLAKVYNNIIEGNANHGIYIPGLDDQDLTKGPQIFNNVIKNNAAQQGGGIYVLYSHARIFNNIVINNNAVQYGGGIKGWQLGANFQIGYNNVWNNTAGIGEANYGTCPKGLGAISLDPSFSDVDYRLSETSPCKDAGNPDAQYNDIIDNSRNDMGIYGGPMPFGVPAWVLNMPEMNWYPAQAPYNSTGAAVNQMILNYIREGAGAGALTQDSIYEYARSPQVYGPELNADEVDKALGHFDPYDLLVSNSYDVYDSLAGGNPFQGYNYGVDTYDPNSDIDAINNYMRDICHWMAYRVTREEWWKHGALVARPNTPAAIPIYGTYNHWVAVKGCVTSANPAPDSATNPWDTPDFTVYGFWIKDPLITGIGQNTYKTAAECQSTYFLPLVSTDAYNGKFLQVAEPPAQMSDAHVEITAPVPAAASLKFIGADAPSASGLKATAQPLKKKSWRDLVDAYLLSDPEAVAAFEGTQMGKAIFVRRLDAADNYYLVPFGNMIRGRFLVSGVIILDAKEGYFKEASWTTKREVLLVIDKQAALRLLRNYINARFTQDLTSLRKQLASGAIDLKTYLERLRKIQNQYLQLIMGLHSTKLELVWRPNGYSLSPYRPYWQANINGKVFYVTQEGKVIAVQI